MLDKKLVERALVALEKIGAELERHNELLDVLVTRQSQKLHIEAWRKSRCKAESEAAQWESIAMEIGEKGK